MYEAALNQAYSLCSFSGIGYDGQPSGASGVNGGTDSDGHHDISTIRVRIYWCKPDNYNLHVPTKLTLWPDAFVHEGITTGLKGGRLHLDDGDLETIQDSIHHRALVINSQSFRSSVKMATAPINLAVSPDILVVVL
jgi:hypothetical protein